MQRSLLRPLCALILTLMLASICGSALASVTISIGGAQVFQTTFNPAPDGSLMFAVSMPSGNYSHPTVDNWVTGDNILLPTFWVTDDSLAGPGGFGTALTFDLTPQIVTGHQIAIVWFPEFTNMSSGPAFGSIYGFYTDLTWTVPSDGGTVEYEFETESIGGPLPDSAGLASFTVVPEPSTWLLIGLGLTCLLVLRRRPAVR